MLKYFKYLAVISFILVLVCAFSAGVYFRSFASMSVIESPVKENNEIVASQFRDSVLCKYASVFNKLDQLPVNKWRDDKYFKSFEKMATVVLSANSAAKINLYNKKFKLFFSSNESDIIFFGDEDANFIKDAQSSGSVARMLSSMGINYEDGRSVKGSYIQHAMALDLADCIGAKPQSGESTQITMEVYNDITKPWEKLYFFQAVISLGIVVTFLLLYLALFLTSRKTERLINKQHEEKLNLEKAKSAAEAQSQQKSMFLANVSHELRTPLNAIIGFSEIIKDEVMGPVGHPQYKEYVADINTSGVHLLSLINDILDYSKAEARKLDVEVVDIDLSKIAHSCMRLVEPRANDAKVKLVENLPESHVVLAADPKRMKQIILNLLSNAVKFTQEEGEVSMTIREDVLDSTISLTVTDTGIGIAPKDISKAMAPFGQIDSSISRRYEGTGLGLPLSKKLTELMGGKFEIKSEVGLGTTIILTFPVAKGQTEDETDKF